MESGGSADRARRAGRRADAALAATVAELRAENAAVRQAAAERTVIDRAAGLLAGQAGRPVDEALDGLTRRARREHRRLVDVAQAFLDLWPGRGAHGSGPHGSGADGSGPPVRAGSGTAGPDGTAGAVPGSAAADGPDGTAAGATIAAAGPDADTDVGAARDPADLAHRLRTALREAAGAGAVMLHVLEPEGSLREVATAGVPARVASEWRWVPAALDAPALTAARTGRPQWLPDFDAASRRFAFIGQSGLDWASRAWVPVEGDDGTMIVTGVFWESPDPLAEATRERVNEVVRLAARRAAELLVCSSDLDFAPVAVQTVFDMIPGSMVLITPIRDDAGRIVDYRIHAATRKASEAAGRRGRRLVGARVLEAYPKTAGTELWDLYLRVLATGEPGELGPYPRVELDGGDPVTSTLYFRVQRFGQGLLVEFVRHDEEERQLARLEQIQRLGSLGWAEVDLTTGQVEWSTYLYLLFGRDPADGPMGMDELARVVLPADLPAVKVAIAGLLTGSESADVRFRVRVSGDVRDIRVIMQATVDDTGRTVKLSSLAQDISDLVQARLRVEQVEQQLADRQRVLDAEHRLAEELRQIILPLPAAPVNLPGLQVAVRYLPAEHAALVGGDWYHATALADGTVLLAMGDVAGHGLAAAATMAELRHALAALTVTTADPAELLGYLNRMLCGREADLPRTATAVIARFDWANGTLTWAQAGHPAPLLVRAGTASRLRRPRGMLLGAHSAAVYATDRLVLTPDDVLLLFTDGLTEPHGGGPDERLDDVVASLLSSLSEGQSLTDLLRRLPPANPADDMCIMVARTTS